MANDDATHLADSATEDVTLRERFDALVSRWKSERGPHSSCTRLTDNPAYQEIINVGSAVVPILLREMECAPDHWFRALHVLTGADPVPEASRGKVREMAAAWLRWANDNGSRW